MSKILGTRIGIIGSRTERNLFHLKDIIYEFIDCHGFDTVSFVSGGADGVDAFAEDFAKKIIQRPILVIPGEWNKYGKSAGYRRNPDIVKNSDVVLAFWDGESRGTRHGIDLCKSNSVPVYIFNLDGEMLNV